MDVARTQLQRSESVEQPFSSMPRSHHVIEVLTTIRLRCHYVHAVFTTPLLRSYCVPIRPRPHYAFLNMFQVRPRPCRPYYTPTASYKFLLRSYYALQVLTELINFFKDAVRTWLSVNGYKSQIVSILVKCIK